MMNRTLLLTAKKNNTNFMIQNIVTATIPSLIVKIHIIQQILFNLPFRVKPDTNKETLTHTIMILEAISSNHQTIPMKLGMNM